MGERQACGCPAPMLEGLYGLVEPRIELLLEVDAEGWVVAGYPHVTDLTARPLCQRVRLGSLFHDDVARLLWDRIGSLRASREPSSVAVPRLGLNIRITYQADGAYVMLRRSLPSVATDLARATISDESFWQLFEAAPIPLAIEVATSPAGEGASRFNRQFTKVFGYTALDVPTVHHWWPLAYPDESYRSAVRDEWFRRVTLATLTHSSIAPMRTNVTCKDGSQREVEFCASAIGDRYVVAFIDLTDHNRALRQLSDAKAQVRALSELLPVCAWCKRLRDDSGYWQLVEEFIERRTGAMVTHGICPDCRKRHFVTKQSS